MKYVTLIFSHDHDDWISNIISWFTFGEYTHVAIVNGDEVIEATGKNPNPGVRISKIQDFINNHKKIEFRKLEHSNPDAVWEKAKSQLGKKYDWFWMLGYLLHSNKLGDADKWSCSEFVAWALGEEIIHTKHQWYINPQTIYIFSKEV